MMIRKTGYTLLEMVVVLSIIGLISAITVPRLNLMYKKFEASLERDDILSQIKVLGYKAYRRGHGFTLEQALNDSELLILDEGWQLKSGHDIYYSAIGTCSGGSGELAKDNLVLKLIMDAPFCNPSIVNEI